MSERIKFFPREAREEIRKAYAQTELILSSIPSILIGVSQGGVITHWNAVAERTFGIPAENVMRRPFSDCNLPWDSAMVLGGIRDCVAKGSTVRVDDIPFRRLNGERGFLGMTLIPLRQDTGGAVEYILFGADITERKRVDELKKEFVSTVSHELRTPLTIIREGVSQVLDGILGEVNPDQKQALSMSLEGMNRLGRIVDDLLDISKIESGKLTLKREPVNVVNLAKGVASAFHARAKERGLEIQTCFPSGPVELYADKDRVIQVVTNLLYNAIKFTEKGKIEISVTDKGNSVECGVADTGKGIAPEDLPRVFGKFQQFSRTAGPGEKGTGLGLAICKGIVEAHSGQIWVESKLGEGTKFGFRLPKYTAKELFKEHISKSLTEAVREEASLSLIVFEVRNFDLLQERMGPERSTSLILGLEGLIKRSLRRGADVAIKDTRAILILLPATGKEEALMVAGRIQQTFDDYLASEGLTKQVDLTCKVATFPEDGNTEEELLTKVGGF